MSRIFKTVKILLIAILVGCSQTIWAESSDAAGELERLMGDLQTMKASFVQTTTTSKGRVRSSGEVVLARPGRFRWDVQSPRPQLFVADGANVWVYDKGLSQVSRHPLSYKGGNPASLLSSSVANLRQQYQITALPQDGNVQGFHLQPKNGGGLFRWVNLYFKNDRLVAMAMLNNLGQSSTFSFANVRMNPSVDSSLFRVNAGRGVDVIRD